MPFTSSLLFTSDRSRASLSLVFEVGERAGPGHAFTPTANSTGLCFAGEELRMNTFRL